MLDIRGTVNFSVDGRRGILLASGRRLEVDFETPAAFESLGGRRRAHDLATALHAAGLTLTVSEEKRPLAVLGREARPGLMSRLMRIRSVEFEKGGFRRLAFARFRKPRTAGNSD